MKMRMTLALIASFCLTQSASAEVASDVAVTETGATSSYSVTVAERPLTLMGGALNADANLLFKGGFGVEVLEVGASYGILDDLEVGLRLPFTFGLLDEPAAARDITLGAVYRFLSGDLELGAALDVKIPVETDFALSAGVPLHYHAGMARLRSGVMLDVTFASSTVLGMRVPLGVDMALTEALNLSVETGLDINSFDGFAWDIPLGVALGYTFGSASPTADLNLVFELPNFASDAGVEASDYMIGLKSRIYIL